MKPIPWAVAIVLILVFGAATYRMVISCEPSSIEFINKLKVDLKGDCPKPLASPQPTIPAPSAAVQTQPTSPPVIVNAPDGVAIGRDMNDGTINQGTVAPAQPSDMKSSAKAHKP